MEWTAPRPGWWQPAMMAAREHSPGHGRRHGPGRGWGGHGGPPWMRGGFPPGFSPFGAPRQRRERGDVRLAVLGLLAEEAMHGYQLIREVARRSGGTWRISPGSVYPMLSQLEDEGLVVADDSAGRRSFALTDTGRAEVRSRADEFAALWDDDADPVAQGWQDLAGLVAQVAAAAVQVGSEGTEAQRERAADLLEDTRRALYRLLADDDGEQRP